MNNLVKLSFDSSAQQAFLNGMASDSTGKWTPSRTRLFKKSLEARIADPKVSQSVKNNAQKALDAMSKAEKGGYSLGKAQFNNLRKILQFDAPGKITPDSPQYRRYAVKREAPGTPIADSVSDSYRNREYEINKGRANRRPFGARGKESYELEKMLFEEDAVASRNAQIENSKARHQKSIEKQRARAARLKARDSVKAQQAPAPTQQAPAPTQQAPAPTQQATPPKATDSPRKVAKQRKLDRLAKNKKARELSIRRQALKKGVREGKIFRVSGGAPVLGQRYIDNPYVAPAASEPKTPAPKASSGYTPPKINKGSKVKGKNINITKVDPHQAKGIQQERARIYTPEAPSASYEGSYVQRPKQPSTPKAKPEFKPRRSTAPSGSVNVNKAIEDTVAKAKALPGKAGRAISGAASDAMSKGKQNLNIGSKLYLDAADELVAKGTQKGKDALRAVGDMDHALTEAGKQKARDLKIGSQMVYEDASTKLKSGRQRLLSALSKGKQDLKIGGQLYLADAAEKGRRALGAIDSAAAKAIDALPESKPAQPTPAQPTPAQPNKLRKRLLKKRLSTPTPAKAPVNVAPTTPAKAPVNVAPPTKSLPTSTKAGTKALSKIPYGKYGLGAALALGTGYAIHKGYKALKSKNDMKKVSNAPMSNGMPKNAVQSLLKTASAKLIEQERELEQLRQWYNEAQVLTKAASVADRMVATGHLDYSERDNKAIELASSPERLPIVEEAINMMGNPSAFSVASISDEYGEQRNARTQLESYLLGN